MSFERISVSHFVRAKIFSYLDALVKYAPRQPLMVPLDRRNGYSLQARANGTKCFPFDGVLPIVSRRKRIVTKSDGFRVSPPAVPALNTHLAAASASHSHLRCRNSLGLSIMDAGSSDRSTCFNGPAIRVINHISIVTRHIDLLSFVHRLVFWRHSRLYRVFLILSTTSNKDSC